MMEESLVVLDIGGTKIQAGSYRNGKLESSTRYDFAADKSEQAIFDFICEIIEQTQQSGFAGIAVGVPTIVDVEQGIVFNAVNIPAWQCYPLKAKLAKHFSVPVYVNNDVNCFTYGVFEHQQVQLQSKQLSPSSLIGMCLGTGFGTGIIINNSLHAGKFGSAGEFGGIKYLEGTIDDYCSGKFFTRFYGETGEQLALKAKAGDEQAQAAFDAFGGHLGEAIMLALFIIDPDAIVLGGSVAKDYDLFKTSMEKQLKQFPYPCAISGLNISACQQADMALMGAAQLFLEQQKALK